MRRLDFQPAAPPRDLGEVPFKSLYVKEIYDAPTKDGWVLQISRYRPIGQAWEQPILGEPILLVPGWSQNRHCFTCGNFVKQLLAFGADVHILELRGHGRSGRDLQIERGLRPADLDWDWDLDSYFLHDIPAGVQAVKQKTGRAKIFYLGASMGGMLGYGYAGCHDDLLGMVTIGAPSDLGRIGFSGLRAVALLAPALLGPVIDAACRAASGILRRPVRFNHVPVDSFMRAAATGRVRYMLRGLFNPARVAEDDLCFLHRLRLQGALQGHPHSHGDHLRRPGQDRFPPQHPRHLPRGAQRVPGLAAGEGQQPPRIDHGVGHPPDLRGREGPGGVRRAIE
ncbi:MAG TPA: alpha/beta fold hydrolase [Myxococcales bacterium]